MSTDGEFRELLVTIFSAEHLQIYGAAGAWLAMASLSASSDDWLSGAAAETAAEPGVGLIELAERMENSAATAQEIAVLAGRVAGQLQSAGDASARATEEALVLLFEYEETNGDPPGADVGMAANAFYERQLEEKRRLITEAARVLSDLGADFSKVTGGEVTAPGGGSGGGAGGGGISAGAAGGNGAAGSGGPVAAGSGQGPAMVATANGGQVGPGTYPDARVLGPDRGDFAGWVQSPGTGFLVDPATGREFDPVTGRWIDPVTGRPFGEVTEYAARLSGLGSGPGAIVTGSGLAAVGGGAAAAGLAGLYGGTMPPSVGHTGPARGPMMQQALRNLSHRASVASGFAAREAAMGGRPYSPPPGAAAQRGAAAATRMGKQAGTPAAGRIVPPAATVRPHPAVASAGRAADRLGAARPAPPAPGSAGRPGPRTTAGRGAGTALREPAATWRGSRAADTAGRLAPQPPPGAGAAKSSGNRPERKSGEGRPTRLTEDPSVWSSRRDALGGVLGEQEKQA
ncbi:hypothetical protein MTQ13_15775 [Streptomyces sp. XM4011]|uniref:hypothetical protein n=1 Tax=Streptomyces sp. XM4011 TaxID=2929780 RepID=UPI001FF86662|nr:hypothetical protein [Streptomyces sp. XM4011]MCK1815722.1 hypothetical protein [Streptomyces sp. XM4011]